MSIIIQEKQGKRILSIAQVDGGDIWNQLDAMVRKIKDGGF